MISIMAWLRSRLCGTENSSMNLQSLWCPNVIPHMVGEKLGRQFWATCFPDSVWPQVTSLSRVPYAAGSHFINTWTSLVIFAGRLSRFPAFWQEQFSDNQFHFLHIFIFHWSLNPMPVLIDHDTNRNTIILHTISSCKIILAISLTRILKQKQR